MDSSCYKFSPFVSAFVVFLVSISSVCSVQFVNFNNTTQNFRHGNASNNKYIKTLLKKINKPAVKTIQSPDGDIIDCVATHLQLAFDHPLLKGQKPIMEEPEMPIGNTSRTDIFEENIKVWSMSGECCPENTIPIRRTTEEDVVKATSVRMDDAKQHEHATGFANGNFLGARAIINLWHPIVETEHEFSLSQIWVTAGSIEHGDLNTVEAGWKVDYGDLYPKLFIYWTSDAYQTTGCYNLKCPGFVQTSRKITIGEAIRPVSSYNSNQYDITFSVWKDLITRHWWLSVNDNIVGYWPRDLFTLLNKGSASRVEFGGETINTKSSGGHTSTQMGSGHFPTEGYKRASYFRNIHVVSSTYTYVPPPELQGSFENKKCYYAGTGKPSKTWGTYFFYGGPGRNPNCP